MSTYHPSDATLAAYGAGSLPEGLAIVVATHMAFCPTCKAQAAMTEVLGGAVLEEMAPAAMEPDALLRVLARTADAGAEPPRPAPVVDSSLPPPLDRCTFGRWWRVSPGLRFRPMRVGGRAWVGLLQVGAGRSLPPHMHDGLELACVLQGSFIDGGGHYAVGDLSEPGLDHSVPPRVDSAEPCLCVIGSEGMRLSGVLGLAQRLLGR